MPSTIPGELEAAAGLGDADEAPLPTRLENAFRRLDRVDSRQVSWLWRHRIPAARLSIVAGHQGVGKSHVAMKVAADLTRGGKRVLWISAEDDDEDTTVPRLRAAGAAMESVWSMKADHVLTIPDDVPDLERWILEAEADVVFLDPVLAFLGLRSDAHRDHHVRRVLTPLRALAAGTRCAIVGVMHLKKGDEREAVNAVGGSIAWTAVPRSVMLVTRAADRAADVQGRVLWHPKCNIGEEQPPLEFRIVGRGDESSVEFGEENRELRLEDHMRRAEASADDAPALAEARDFIRGQIADGDVSAREALRAAKAAGISDSSLKRAKSDLIAARELSTFPGGRGSGGHGGWMWGPYVDDQLERDQEDF